MKIIKRGNKVLGEYNLDAAYKGVCDYCNTEFAARENADNKQYMTEIMKSGRGVVSNCPVCGGRARLLERMSFEEWEKLNDE